MLTLTLDLSALNDSELDKLSLEVSKETRKRAEDKIREGNYIYPTEQERLLYKVIVFRAIKAYQERTQSPLLFAKAVMDHVCRPNS